MFAFMLGLVAGALTLATLGVELMLRLKGYADFPIYNADPVLGYVPRPNQRGRLFKRADWAFNDLSMGTPTPFAPRPDDVLLIGDSLVFCSAQTPQDRKLGPRLQALIGRRVWPASAGSWGLANELAYIERNPQVMACGTIVFVLNTGDFQGLSVWRSSLTHPRRKPLSLLFYGWRKRYFTPRPPKFEWPSAEQQALWSSALDRLLSTYAGRPLFVLYPDRQEMVTGEDKFGPFRKHLAGRAEILEVRPLWSVDDYSEDGMHPKPETEGKLAQIIAARLQRRSATERRLA